jgi:hypothetical protein
VTIAKNNNFLALVAPTPQREGTLENSGEMLGWELRELRLRVTKNNKISKSSQMRNKNLEKKPSNFFLQE